MNKLLLFILFEVLILSACADSITQTPTYAIAPPNDTPTLMPTETTTPSPSITLTSSLEPISGGRSTFHDKKYGISFVYPAVFDKGYYDQEYFCHFETEQEGDHFRVKIGMSAVRVYETNLSLQDYVDSFVASLSDSNWKFTQTHFSKDGIPAIRLGYSLENPSRYSESTYIPSKGIIVVANFAYHPFIDCETKDLDYSNYGVYQQIINTLKFEK